MLQIMDREHLDVSEGQYIPDAFGAGGARDVTGWANVYLFVEMAIRIIRYIGNVKSGL